MADARIGALGVNVLSQLEPQPRIGAVGVDVLSQLNQELYVGFFGIDVITQKNAATSTMVSGAGLEVLLKNDPTSRASHTIVEVLMTADPVAEISWLGSQTLASIDENFLVKAEISWIGNQVLADATQSFNIGWLGSQALIDIREFDDIPDTFVFDTIYDGVPGETYTAGPFTVTGMSTGTVVYLKSTHEITFSVNGAPATSPAAISQGDTVEMFFVVENLFSNAIIQVASREGDIEVGQWPVEPIEGRVEPVHRNYLRDTDWIEIKAREDQPTNSSSPIIDPLPTYTGNELNAVFEDNTHQLPDFAPSVGHQYTHTELKSPELQATQYIARTQYPITGFDSTDRASLESRHVDLYFDREFEFKTGYAPERTYEPADRFEKVTAEKAHWLRTYNPQIKFETSHVYPNYHPGFNRESSHHLYEVAVVWMQETPHDQHKVALVWQKKKTDSQPGVAPIWDYQAQPDLEKYENEAKAFTFAVTTNLIPVSPNFLLHSTRKERPVELNSRFQAHDQKHIPVAIMGRAQTLKVWNPDNYVEMGGFATQQEAIADVQSRYPNSSYVIYQQPEGTYSYMIDRNTGLVCDATVVPGTGLKAVAWLLGGG